MSSRIQCKAGKWIALPEQANVNVQDKMLCPSSCPLLVRCPYTEQAKLTVVKILALKAGQENSVSILKYTEQEKEKLWGSAGLSNVSEIEKDTPIAPQTASNQSSMPKSEQVFSRTGGANKYNAMFKASNSANQTGSLRGAPVQEMQSDTVFVNGKKYESCFEMQGVIYTDNAELMGVRYISCKPLRYALTDIFYGWKWQFVFENSKANSLRKQFLWLASQIIKRNTLLQEFESVLSSDQNATDLNKKFFYLFYDVVFKRNPIGAFYYPVDNYNGHITNLDLRFKDKEDFALKYCQDGESGKYFRNFYKTSKREIWHYLNFSGDSDSEFFSEITTFIANSQKKIVHISKKYNFEPVYLGTVDQFILDMQTFSDCQTMLKRLEFLKEYAITPLKQVKLRDMGDQLKSFNEEVDDKDDRIYFVLGISQTDSSNCATVYDTYTTILKEYCAVFKPSEIRVGQYKFTERNYSKEIETYTQAMCACLFGDATDEHKNQAIGCAWLARNLYTRRVLNFRCENQARIDRLTALIEMAVPKIESDAKQQLKLALEKYFDEFSSNPTIYKNNREISVRDYIASLVTGDAILSSEALKKDLLVQTYFKTHCIQVDKNLTQIFASLDQMYDKFLGESK